MKLIVDINDNEYISIKEYPNNITSYPITIHIYDAIRNGTPFEEVGDIITIESVMKILSKYKLEESKIAEEIKENKNDY